VDAKMEPTLPVFFQKKFATNNNWGFVVGFDADNLLMLEKKPRTEEWELRPISIKEIVQIKVRQYRSIYVYVLGTLSALVGLFVTYIGFTGEAAGPGIFTIPVICAVFSYFAFSGGKRIRIDFETKQKSWKYKSEPGNYDETYAVLPEFINWVKARNLCLTVEISVERAKIAA
jgi:hypothetical protein